MSLGTGYEYLLSSVVRGDGAVAPSSPLTRYYAESGTPPGRWLGSGLTGLNDALGIAEGSVVTEEQLFHLLGMLADPVTGRPLGTRPLRLPPPLAERIRQRVAQLPPDLVGHPRAVAVAAIERDEADRQKTIRRPVAGFDLTFSVPKSVSVVWAVADGATQVAISKAHQDAIRIALSYAEQHIVFSRSGHAGAVQEPIRGVIAAAFDHWDSRAGDPHLHTHLVVANRVQTLDGLWRTLDSKTLHKYVVALSELHEGVLQDLLTNRLGYAWDERTRRHSNVPRWEIAGVPDELIREFSRRSSDIDAATIILVTDFARARGRQPTAPEVLRLRQQATLQTRPDKQLHTLVEQTTIWRDRTRPFVAGGTAAWADTLRNQAVLPALDHSALDVTMLEEIAPIALETVAKKRSTFSHANVLAEVHRQLHGTRFATGHDRLAAARPITDAALSSALLLTSPDRVAVGAQIWTTQAIVDAETRLLEAGRSTDGPAVPADVVDEFTADEQANANANAAQQLGPDQAAAVHAIATSGRELDVLVGPAGSGKTTSLAALRRMWEDEHGSGSVIGLAPSAAAADVLADELGIETENTAKWLHEAARQDDRLDRMAELIDRIQTQTSSPSTALSRELHTQLGALYEEYEQWMIRPNQLVIVDEAGLAGTLALDRLIAESRDAGGKVLLVGDWAQLGAIDSGGAFTMLVNDRPDVPELSTVRRFQNEWEREASLQLRIGEPAAIDAYADHDRIRSGDRSDVLDQLYRAWRADTDRGLTSLMIAGDYESVAELNVRARADRVAVGEVESQCVEIAGGGIAGVGDHVVTRQNDRRLAAGRGWVKNGDGWTVRQIGPDASLVVQRERDRAEAVLPGGYVRSYVELGYAATAFRAQGRTVDTSHSLISATTTREALYVSATRGRSTNTIYVNTDSDLDPETSHDAATRSAPTELLHQVLVRTNADTSAHAVIELERQLTQSLESRELERRAAFIESPTVTGHHADRGRSISPSVGT